MNTEYFIDAFPSLVGTYYDLAVLLTLIHCSPHLPRLSPSGISRVAHHYSDGIVSDLHRFIYYAQQAHQIKQY